MAKQRWKTSVELVVGLAGLLVGVVWLEDAIGGGPAYHWLGVLVMIASVERVHARWEEL